MMADPAPTFEQLPAAMRRRLRHGEERVEIAVNLEVVTPILGGAAQVRQIDEVDIIRVPSIRGQLRFWWRALHGHEYETSKALYDAEGKLWGHAADEGGRSTVDLRVDLQGFGAKDESDIDLKDAAAYALWPTRSEKKTNKPPAPRRKPGTRFRLVLATPKAAEEELRNVARAWILFGGYGGRTRRGLGSFKVTPEDAQSWLPKQATRDALTALFGRDILAPPDGNPKVVDAPWFAGASLHAGTVSSDPMKAWTTALGWLKDFRQGTGGDPGNRAREPGKENRPSISNWPEADKLRHLAGKTRSHPPRHNANFAWPRAGFGLPIVGKFQDKARDGGRLDEPGGFELRWSSNGAEHDRLASPLIVEALPLADGKFVPCALWLNRAYPEGQVVLKGKPNSGALFDLLVAPGDKPLFKALDPKSTLRRVFLDWLKEQRKTTVVAP